MRKFVFMTLGICLGNVIRPFLIAAVAAGFLAGCTSDVANRYYSSEHFPPRDPTTVEILSDPPTRAYEVIADFQSRGDTPKSLQEKAAEIGADAVIVVQLGGYVQYNAEWARQQDYHSPYDHIIGTAIKYK